MAAGPALLDKQQAAGGHSEELLFLPSLVNRQFATAANAGQSPAASPQKEPAAASKAGSCRIHKMPAKVVTTAWHLTSACKSAMPDEKRQLLVLNALNKLQIWIVFVIHAWGLGATTTAVAPKSIPS